MSDFDNLRATVRRKMGRECDVPLADCSVCRRNLRELTQVLAVIDLAEAAQAAYKVGRTSTMGPALQALYVALAAQP